MSRPEPPFFKNSVVLTVLVVLPMVNLVYFGMTTLLIHLESSGPGTHILLFFIATCGGVAFLGLLTERRLGWFVAEGALMGSISVSLAVLAVEGVARLSDGHEAGLAWFIAMHGMAAVIPYGLMLRRRFRQKA